MRLRSGEINISMLWLACRHQLMEIMLSAVVDQLLAPSNGPNIQIPKIQAQLKHNSPKRLQNNNR